MQKEIGIIGSGIVGQTLANGFPTNGCDVMFATNTPTKREELKTKTSGKAGVSSSPVRYGRALVYPKRPVM